MGDRATLLGREEELGAVDAFLDDVAVGPAMLVLSGEPGIGKTALWDEACRRARGRNMTVMQSRPAAAETRIAFSGLADLLAEAGPETLGVAPQPQRDALTTALSRNPSGSHPYVDSLALALGVLTVVREMATSHPVLLAIDDAQWLDAPTREILQYALRRISSACVGLLIAEREPAGSAELERVFEADPCRVRIGPLTEQALGTMIAHRTGLTLRPPDVQRICRACRGNPFFALQIARLIAEQGPGPRVDRLPIPPDVAGLLEQTVRTLPAGTQELLSYASAVGCASVSLLDPLMPHVRELLLPAIDAGIVELALDEVVFVHPLFAAAVQARTPDDVRRQIHLRLANATEDPEERGRHIAAGISAPDTQAAGVVEEAATKAHRRGAPADGAELMERAAELTPDDEGDERWRRSIRAVELYEESGHPERARGLVDRLVEQYRGPQRGWLLERFGALLTSVPSVAIASFREAIEEAGGDPHVAAASHIELSWRLQVTEGMSQAALRHAELGLELAERSGDGALLAQALGVRAMIDFFIGRGVQRDALDRSGALAPPMAGGAIGVHPNHMRVMQLLWGDDLAEVSVFLEDLLDGARRAGSPLLRGLFGPYLAVARCRLGELQRAEELAREMVELWIQLGAVQAEGPARWVLADALAHRGLLDDAREEAAAATVKLAESENRFFQIHNEGTRGFIALSEGDFAEAARILSPLPARIAAFGIKEPSTFRIVPDLVEVLVSNGRLARANRLTEDLAAAGADVGRPWACGAGRRGSALVASAAGDVEGAIAHAEAAVAFHRNVDQPFELARTLLVAGTILRRARRKKDARRALEEARALFDSCGAMLWRDRALYEAARIGGKPASGSALTAVEGRIAALAGAGRSNREIASTMFLTPKTVEWHLSRIYRKLHVNSRTALAALLRAGAGSDEPTR